MLYLNEGLHYKHRDDLELRNIEKIWIDLAYNPKHILFGLFYRSSNSVAGFLAQIGDSFSLAVGTGISEVIVTVDFKLNADNQQNLRKIHLICTQFSLFQCTDRYTHCSEYSSSLNWLLIVTSKGHLIDSGVGDAFLNQVLGYHCAPYGIFKFSKPKMSSFRRRI